jgi:hypothetical protein
MMHPRPSSRPDSELLNARGTAERLQVLNGCSPRGRTETIMAGSTARAEEQAMWRRQIKAGTAQPRPRE